MRIFRLFSVLALVLCGCSASDNTTSWITIDETTFDKLKFQFSDDISVKSHNSGLVTFKAPEETIAAMSKTMHGISSRCGGFFASNSEGEAKALELDLAQNQSWVNEHNYRVRGHRVIDHFLSKVNPEQIRKRIDFLSNKFHNRYYQSETGVKSQVWLAQSWRNLNVRRRNDFHVKLYKHKKWEQPSVIASIIGSKHPEEMVIIGGHGDSINGWGGKSKRAPGADDNASGISTVSEILRVILSSTYRPSRTLVFMSYAAEEVGLRGSREIAKAYKENNKKVVAVMQLDMTNHRTEDGVISFIRDHTDDKLTVFTQALANRYLSEVKWVDDKCGYACSDHASWDSAGYPAVFPFESKSSKMNKYIHTTKDTLENSDKMANHAAIFAKLGLAFAMEIAK